MPASPLTLGFLSILVLYAVSTNAQMGALSSAIWQIRNTQKGSSAKKSAQFSDGDDTEDWEGIDSHVLKMYDISDDPVWELYIEKGLSS